MFVVFTKKSDYTINLCCLIFKQYSYLRRQNITQK